MKKTVCLLLALALALAAFGCAGLPPRKTVSSYEEIKKRFGEREGLIYPDLAPLRFIEDETDYYLDLESKSCRSGISGYTVVGRALCEGAAVTCSFVMRTGKLRTAESFVPILYNGISIRHDASDFSSGREETYCFFLNGYEYSANISYSADLGFSPEEYADLNIAVEKTLYSFLCGIIDASKIHQHGGSI